MTSRYRGEKAVPFSLKGMGIPPIVERSVVSGIDVPLLSFPRFHGFRQTNRTPCFAIGLNSAKAEMISFGVSSRFNDLSDATIRYGVHASTHGRRVGPA